MFQFDGRFKQIVSPRRKRTALRINADGVLEVHTPPGVTEKEIRLLLAANKRVVTNLFKSFARRPPAVRYRFTPGEKFPFPGGELTLRLTERLALITERELLLPAGTPEEMALKAEQLYRRAALPLLKEKCRLLGAAHGLCPRSVGITGAKTRWGSCNSAGHISFCWKLLLLPEELADYIVCHELAHLRHLDHSPAFWALTEKLCPGAPAKRKRLQELPELWNTPQ